MQRILRKSPRRKRKKRKVLKKKRKKKSPGRNDLESQRQNRWKPGEAEGEANQENGESADEVGFMTDEGAEVSLDDALDSIRDKDAEAGMEKNPRILCKTLAFLNGRSRGN